MIRLLNGLQVNCKIILLFFSLLGIYPFIAYSAKSEQVSRVLAKVGNEIITTAELDQFLKPMLSKYGDQYNKSEFDNLTKQARQAALKQFIERKLLTQEAETLQINIPEIEIKKEMERIRSQFSSDTDFDNFLETKDISIDEYKELIKDDLTTKVLVHEKVTKKILILPSEIHDFYQLHISEFLQPAQVRMYQILIKKKPTSETALIRAEKLLQELKLGATFQQIARLSSEGPKKTNGGDWGVVEKGFFGDEMKNVEDAAFQLKPGIFSQIIETKYGYHIVYIDRKRISRILTEREAYDSIKQKLFMERYTEALNDYIKYLNGKIYVEIIQPDMETEFSFKNNNTESSTAILNPTITPNISPANVITGEHPAVDNKNVSGGKP
ncbi:SurA N-terminal domain-containing protein [bacterium]|nr:SurA N-terminal domain-containing protein [bacterium]